MVCVRGFVVQMATAVGQASSGAKNALLELETHLQVTTHVSSQQVQGFNIDMSIGMLVYLHTSLQVLGSRAVLLIVGPAVEARVVCVMVFVVQMATAVGPVSYTHLTLPTKA